MRINLQALAAQQGINWDVLAVDGRALDER